MPTIGLILRKFFGIFIFIGSIFKKIYELFFRTRNSQNIGELPFQIPKQERFFNESQMTGGIDDTDYCSINNCKSKNI